MQIGLTVSLLLHAMLLGWALVSFKATPPLKIPEIQPVEVAIITSDDLVRLRKGDRRSKKLETRPADPYSVHLNYFVRDGDLFIDPAEGRRWLEQIRVLTVPGYRTTVAHAPATGATAFFVVTHDNVVLRGEDNTVLELMSQS